jgi:hypothetical protein
MRACLTGSFAILTILAVTLHLTSGLTVWAAAVCGALTAGVLVAGRHAVVVERRAQARRRDAASGAADASGHPQFDEVPAASVNTAPQARTGTPAADPASPVSANARTPARATAGRTAGRDDTADRGAVLLPDSRPSTGRRGRAAGSAEIGDDQTAEDSGWAPSAQAEADAPADQSVGRGYAGGGGTASTAGTADSASARRPGISGRVQGGRAVYHLPESVQIRPVELDEATEPARPRRLTPARPKAVPAAAPEQPAGTPKPKRIAVPAGIPAPTYTLMPGAPKWEPKALTALDYAQAREAAARATQRAAAESLAEGVETAATGEIKIPDRVVFAEAALDLNRAIAARRRAAGL